MRRSLIIAAAVPLCWSHGLSAQQATSAPPAKVDATTTTKGTDVSIGDFWTYDVHDGPSATNESWTFTVTDFNPRKISVRREIAGKPGSTSFLTYDHNWNVLANGQWHFTPSDSTGFPPPFVIGRSLPIHGSSINYAGGHARQRSGIAKLVGQEKLTTKAGTFDVYKFNYKWRARDTQSPLIGADYDISVWFAPSLNHWAKKTDQMRMDGLIREQKTFTLTAWGHAGGASPSAGDASQK